MSESQEIDQITMQLQDSFRFNKKSYLKWFKLFKWTQNSHNQSLETLGILGNESETM